MLLSLAIGIVTSALLAKGNIIDAFWLILHKYWVVTGLQTATQSWDGFWHSWNLLFFLFFIFLGIIIALLQNPDVSYVFSLFIRNKIKNAKTAQIASLLLSACFFIDDYFSAITVGSIMRSCIQLYKIPAVKIAFLITAMASSYAVLSPLSSWVGEIVVQLKQIGVGFLSTNTLVAVDPFYLFVQSIPFIFYPILLIISAWYIVLRGISYGPMHDYEENAFVESAVSYDNYVVKNKKVTTLDFIAPLVILIIGVLLGVLITGGYKRFGGDHTLLQTLQNANMIQALFSAGLFSMLFTIVWFIGKRIISFSQLIIYVRQGMLLMVPSIATLINVWTLSLILKDDLGIGLYVAQLLINHITFIWFPLACFLSAGIAATLIGSAWATIGLMFPVVLPTAITLTGNTMGMTLEHVIFLLPILGATLSGSVLGTHLSFIADNPIMSAASTGASHIDHLKTMFWYLIPVIIGTCIAYALIGILFTMGIYKALMYSITAGMVAMLIGLEIGNYFFSS